MNMTRTERILCSLFWQFAIVSSVVFWIGIWFLIGLAFPAWSHDAPASRKQPHGWSYDLSCCNIVDCRQLDRDEIEETDTGFIWRSKHSGATHVYNHGTVQIKMSKDEFFHGCETNPLTNPAGGVVTEARPLCLYVPNRGI
jgi:hypothetical protein